MTYVALARAYGIPTTVEPRIIGVDGRTDVLLCLGSRRLALDISITHPGAKSYVNAGQVAFGAANQRYAVKIKRYEQACKRQGIEFLPVIAESTGVLHPTAVKVLKLIINKAQPMQYGLTDTTLDRRTMLSVMRARLSCVIHRSNAIAMLADAAARGKRSNRQERKIQGRSSYMMIPMPHER